MDQIESAGGTDSLMRAGAFAKLCLAATVCAWLTTLIDEPVRRTKATFGQAAFVLHASPSTVLADVTAGPEVTSPTANVASFSILPLPLIAAIVDARWAREVLVSRFGGRNGP